MWRKDKYYVLHGMTLNWWFTLLCKFKLLYLKIKIKRSSGDPKVI